MEGGGGTFLKNEKNLNFFIYNNNIDFKFIFYFILIFSFHLFFFS